MNRLRSNNIGPDTDIAEEGDCHEFKARLDYIVSFRSARVQYEVLYLKKRGGGVREEVLAELLLG